MLQALAKSFELTKDWTEEERDLYKRKLIGILDLAAPIPVEKPAIADGEESKKPAAVKKQALP